MSLVLDGTAGITFNNATTQASAGCVLQVVTASYSTTTSTTSSTYSSTGFSASITPKFSSSKILILLNMRPGTVASSQSVNIQIWRGGSSVFQAATTSAYINSTGMSENHGSTSSCYLDSPASTSSVTYTIYYASSNNGQTSYNNINGDQSSITLLEIAG